MAAATPGGRYRRRGRDTSTITSPASSLTGAAIEPGAIDRAPRPATASRRWRQSSSAGGARMGAHDDDAAAAREVGAELLARAPAGQSRFSICTAQDGRAETWSPPLPRRAREPAPRSTSDAISVLTSRSSEASGGSSRRRIRSCPTGTSATRSSIVGHVGGVAHQRALIGRRARGGSEHGARAVDQDQARVDALRAAAAKDLGYSPAPASTASVIAASEARVRLRRTRGPPDLGGCRPPRHPIQKIRGHSTTISAPQHDPDAEPGPRARTGTGSPPRPAQQGACRTSPQGRSRAPRTPRARTTPRQAPTRYVTAWLLIYWPGLCRMPVTGNTRDRSADVLRRLCRACQRARRPCHRPAHVGPEPHTNARSAPAALRAAKRGTNRRTQRPRRGLEVVDHTALAANSRAAARARRRCARARADQPPHTPRRRRERTAAGRPRRRAGGERRKWLDDLAGARTEQEPRLDLARHVRAESGGERLQICDRREPRGEPQCGPRHRPSRPPSRPRPGSA